MDFHEFHIIKSIKNRGFYTNYKHQWLYIKAKISDVFSKNFLEFLSFFRTFGWVYHPYSHYKQNYFLQIFLHFAFKYLVTIIHQTINNEQQRLKSMFRQATFFYYVFIYVYRGMGTPSSQNYAMFTCCSLTKRMEKSSNWFIFLIFWYLFTIFFMNG